MNKVDRIINFKNTYMNNMKTYSDYNDQLFKIYEYDLWKKNLEERSNVIRKIFKENEEAIKDIYEIINDDLNDEIANELYIMIKEFNENSVYDASIMIDIIYRLIAYYNNQENLDYEKLINLNLVSALEEMEFFLRMDNNTRDYNPFEKYLTILSYKDKYKEIKDEKARRGIFLAYYNIIGPLSEIKEEYLKQSLFFYKDALSFYNSDIVQSIDHDNDNIKEEMKYLKDIVLTRFYYYIHEFKEDYINIIKGLLNDNNTYLENAVIDIACDYYDNKIKNEEMLNKIYDLFVESYGKKLEYDGTDSNVNDFCNCLDLAKIIVEIIKADNYDNNIKKYYLDNVGYKLINYIETVPYKNFTNYFDDLSADIFKMFLSFCSDIGEKDNLLTMLVLSRQPLTYIHSIMVEKITIAIAKKLIENRRYIFSDLIELGYDTDDKLLRYLSNAAFYHDLGKCLTLGVINLQNRKLTDIEFSYIKMHPSKSLQLLDNDASFSEYYDVMLGHHKSYDGMSGYPDNFNNIASLYKSAIDLISISDSIDAATDILGRNYTKGKSFYTLLSELNEFKGSRYNPMIVDYINEDNELKEYLNDITGKNRVEVYYDVYRKILKEYKEK